MLETRPGPEAQELCLLAEGGQRGGEGRRRRNGMQHGAGGGITKRLPLWCNRLEMNSQRCCFDSPNAVARTISLSC